MPVFKNKTQGNFVQVYKGILKDVTLTLKERGLLVTLLSLPDEWDFSINGLSHILPDGRDSIKSGLKVLEQKGYLSRYQSRQDKGTFSDLVLEVHDRPQADNPHTEKPITDKPKTENSRQYNNKEYKNNKSNNKQYKGEGNAYDNSKNGKSAGKWTNEELDLYGF